MQLAAMRPAAVLSSPALAGSAAPLSVKRSFACARLSARWRRSPLPFVARPYGHHSNEPQCGSAGPSRARSTADQLAAVAAAAPEAQNFNPTGTVAFSQQLLECLDSAGQLAAADKMPVKNAHLLLAICTQNSGQHLREQLAKEGISLHMLQQALRAGAKQQQYSMESGRQHYMESKLFLYERPQIESSKELILMVDAAMALAARQGMDVVLPEHALHCMTSHKASLDLARAPLAYALHFLLPFEASQKAKELCQQKQLSAVAKPGPSQAATASLTDGSQLHDDQQQSEPAQSATSPTASEPAAGAATVPQHSLPLQTLPLLAKAAASIQTVQDAAHVLAACHWFCLHPNAALQQRVWDVLRAEDVLQQISKLDFYYMPQVLRAFVEFAVPTQNSWTDVLQQALFCLLQRQTSSSVAGVSNQPSLSNISIDEVRHLIQGGTGSWVHLLSILRSLVAAGYPDSKEQLQAQADKSLVRGGFHASGYFGEDAFLRALLHNLQEEPYAWDKLLKTAQTRQQPAEQLLEAFTLLRKLGNKAALQPRNVLLLAQHIFQGMQDLGMGQPSAAAKAGILHDLLAAAAPIPAADASAWASLCLDSSTAVKQAMLPAAWGYILAAGTEQLSAQDKAELLRWVGPAASLLGFQQPADLQNYLVYLGQCLLPSDASTDHNKAAPAVDSAGNPLTATAAAVAGTGAGVGQGPVPADVSREAAAPDAAQSGTYTAMPDVYPHLQHMAFEQLIASLPRTSLKEASALLQAVTIQHGLQRPSPEVLPRACAAINLYLAKADATHQLPEYLQALAVYDAWAEWAQKEYPTPQPLLIAAPSSNDTPASTLSGIPLEQWLRNVHSSLAVSAVGQPAPSSVPTDPGFVYARQWPSDIIQVYGRPDKSAEACTAERLLERATAIPHTKDKMSADDALAVLCVALNPVLVPTLYDMAICLDVAAKLAAASGMVGSGRQLPVLLRNWLSSAQLALARLLWEEQQQVGTQANEQDAACSTMAVSGHTVTVYGRQSTKRRPLCPDSIIKGFTAMAALTASSDQYSRLALGCLPHTMLQHIIKESNSNQDVEASKVKQGSSKGPAKQQHQNGVDVVQLVWSLAAVWGPHLDPADDPSRFKMLSPGRLQVALEVYMHQQVRPRSLLMLAAAACELCAQVLAAPAYRSYALLSQLAESTYTALWMCVLQQGGCDVLKRCNSEQLLLSAELILQLQQVLAAAGPRQSQLTTRDRNVSDMLQVLLAEMQRRKWSSDREESSNGGNTSNTGACTQQGGKVGAAKSSPEQTSVASKSQQPRAWKSTMAALAARVK